MSAGVIGSLCVCFLLAGPAVAQTQRPAPPPPGMVFVPGGEYTPLYAKGAKPRATRAFFMDVTQVTNAQFLVFVTARPEWRRSKVKASLADTGYLAHWAGDLDPGPGAPANAPVTNVSWFAAKAYCETQGKRLPTQDEWEFAARADATRMDATADQAFLRRLLEWYSMPASASPAKVKDGALNVHGLRGLHGLVWEWVHDFNSTMIVGDSRGDGSLERRLFCGAGSLLAADVSNYAAFMRYAFRSSLQGGYCVGSLGFRAARSVDPDPRAVGAPAFDTPYDLPGEWRTHADKPLTLAALRGKVRVLALGFTRCQFACPRIFADMKRIESDLGDDAAKVGFTFLSIDPQNDTPAAMAKKMEELKMDPARWTFLSAPDETVRQVAVALNFRYQMAEGFFAHSNLILVLDENGSLLHRDEVLGADIAPAVKAVRARLAKS